MSRAADPIRTIEEVKAVRKTLANDPFWLAVFTLGINTNMRRIDIATVPSTLLATAKLGESIPYIKDKKYRSNPRKSRRIITVNDAILRDVVPWANRMVKEGQTYLFPGGRHKQGPMHITGKAICDRVSKACRDAGLQGQYSSHSLRKTWGYHLYAYHDAPLASLCWAFNHSSEAVTLDYLCIQREDVHQLFMHTIGE